jgi:hypothetical protein
MGSAHDTLCHEPENLTESYQFHGAVCIALAPDHPFAETPNCVVPPINETLLQQLGVLIQPNYFIPTICSIPESEHANVESMDEIESVSRDFHALFLHLPALSPSL